MSLEILYYSHLWIKAYPLMGRIEKTFFKWGREKKVLEDLL